VIVFELHAKCRVGEKLTYRSRKFEKFFFSHEIPLG
jgi:hypothetical protein